MSVIEKEVDSLGRVVIPIEYRKKLGIEKNSIVLIGLENGFIKIAPQRSTCAICGSRVSHECGIRLCNMCIRKVKSIAEREG